MLIDIIEESGIDSFEPPITHPKDLDQFVEYCNDLLVVKVCFYAHKL